MCKIKKYIYAYEIMLRRDLSLSLSWCQVVEINSTKFKYLNTH